MNLTTMLMLMMFMPNMFGAMGAGASGLSSMLPLLLLSGGGGLSKMLPLMMLSGVAGPTGPGDTSMAGTILAAEALKPKKKNWKRGGRGRTANKLAYLSGVVRGMASRGG